MKLVFKALLFLLLAAFGTLIIGAIAFGGLFAIPQLVEPDYRTSAIAVGGLLLILLWLRWIYVAFKAIIEESHIFFAFPALGYASVIVFIAIIAFAIANYMNWISVES